MDAVTASTIRGDRDSTLDMAAAGPYYFRGPVVATDVQQRARAEYRAGGYSFLEQFVPANECESIVATVEAHRDRMIAVDNHSLIAKQKFYTINGEELEELIPAVPRLTEELCRLVSDFEGRTLAPLDNKTVGLSLNLTPKGGELSWHYDRNLVTAVIHLNEVTGGEFQVYPRYRVRVPNNHHGVRRHLQRAFDLALRGSWVRAVLGHKVVVPPMPGSVCLMDSTCLHQVAPVLGSASRAAIVICYDEPGKMFSFDRTRNYYGYRGHKTKLYG